VGECWVQRILSKSNTRLYETNNSGRLSCTLSKKHRSNAQLEWGTSRSAKIFRMFLVAQQPFSKSLPTLSTHSGCQEQRTYYASSGDSKMKKLRG